MQETITEQQAFEFESCKSGLIESFIIQFFPRYFVWRTKLRYKRYLGVVLYNKIEHAKRQKQVEDLLITMSKLN